MFVYSDDDDDDDDGARASLLGSNKNNRLSSREGSQMVAATCLTLSLQGRQSLTSKSPNCSSF